MVHIIASGHCGLAVRYGAKPTCIVLAYVGIFSCTWMILDVCEISVTWGALFCPFQPQTSLPSSQPPGRRLRKAEGLRTAYSPAWVVILSREHHVMFKRESVIIGVSKSSTGSIFSRLSLYSSTNCHYQILKKLSINCHFQIIIDPKCTRQNSVPWPSRL